MTTLSHAARPAPCPRLLALALALLLGCPAAGPAAAPGPDAPPAAATRAAPRPAVAPPLAANWSWTGMLQGVLGNRARMIQVTLVFMAFGIFILMWGKTK